MFYCIVYLPVSNYDYFARCWCHSRRRRIWTSRKCIHNAIVMFKYRNSYAIATNSFGNSKFVIKFAHNKNLKYKLRICQVYKSEALVDNKDLCVIQIPNMPWKFAVPTYLLSKSKFGNELAVFANWITYLNIMNALRMHLCDLQIWRRLQCVPNNFKIFRTQNFCCFFVRWVEWCCNVWYTTEWMDAAGGRC